MTYDAALDFPTLDDAAITADADMGDIDFAFSDIGSGNPLWWIIVCTVTGTSGAEAEFLLRTSVNDAGLGAGTVLLRTPVMEYITLIAGEMIYAAPLPTGTVLGKVRAEVVVTNGAGTALQVKSWIGSHPQTGMGIRTPIAAST